MTGPTSAPSHAPAVRPAAPARPPARGTPPLKLAEEPAAALRVLVYLRLHWLMILFCGGLLGAGLAYAAWTLLPPKFESTAVIMVAQNPAGVTGGPESVKGQADFQTYMRTQKALIMTDSVLRHAMNNAQYKITDLPTLQGKPDQAVLRFLAEKVMLDDTAQVLRISLEGDKPDDIRKIVDAVKDAYLDRVVQREMDDKKVLRVQVDLARLDLEKRIRRLIGVKPPAAGAAALTPPAAGPAGLTPLPGAPVAAAVPDIDPPAGPAGVAAPAAESTKQRTNRANRALGIVFAIEERQLKYPSEVRALKAAIADLEGQREALKTGPASAEGVRAADQDPEVLAARFRARQLRQQAESAESVARNPNSPQVADALSAAADAETAVRGLKLRKLQEIETVRRRPEFDKLRDGIAAKQAALKDLAERAELDKQQLVIAQRAVDDAPPDPKADGELGPVVDPAKSDLLSFDNRYVGLTQRWVDMELDLLSPPRVKAIQNASAPTPKDSKKQVMATILAGLLGFGLVGLGVVAAETRAKRVSSLSELTSAGSTPVVGVLPWDPAAVGGDPLKQAELTESIDKLRSYVAQTWLTRGATTVAVTSPVGDEGKAFTAFGLAASLAAAGYRTLLVDFDLRAPTLHQLAGVENDLGVCELLRGEADPRTTPRPLPSGLHFVPAGRWTEETRSAAVGTRLDTVLRKLRDPFDCVILHGHALLTVAEAVEIARRAEVVLLCTRYRETRLPLLKRAADRVATLEVPYSGVVYVGATGHEALC